MGKTNTRGQPTENISNPDLLAILQSTKGGYALRNKTARIWLAIIRSLDQQGPPMTVRGLFYNCENVHHVVSKSEAGYNQVAKQVLAMRRAGVLPYGWIADNTRWVRKPDTYAGLQAYFEHGRKAYRRALWDNQKDYVEIWCEKDAIAGILNEITDEWDVPLYVIKGYSSETFVYNAAEHIKTIGKPTFIYYFGDWDKHGVNISRDIERKLRGFGARFYFERVAVLPQQITEWKLPTRPGKDAGWGDCVEVDAIPADMLRDLAKFCIKAHIDDQVYQAAMRAEELERITLQQIQDNWGLASNC